MTLKCTCESVSARYFIKACNTSESKPQCSMDLLMLTVKNGLCIFHNIALNTLLDTYNKVLIFSPNNSMIVGNFMQNTDDNRFFAK